jgi:hypothetical protein
MVRRGVFVPEPNGRYFMDERAAVEFLRQRRHRALLFGGILLLLFALLWLFGVLKWECAGAILAGRTKQSVSSVRRWHSTVRLLLVGLVIDPTNDPEAPRPDGCLKRRPNRLERFEQAADRDSAVAIPLARPVLTDKVRAAFSFTVPVGFCF